MQSRIILMVRLIVMHQKNHKENEHLKEEDLVKKLRIFQHYSVAC